MKTFVITIERQMFQTHDLEIEAEDADEARELAEEEIPNIAPDGSGPRPQRLRAKFVDNVFAAHWDKVSSAV